MGNLTYTVYANHPRVPGIRDTDKTTLTARTNSSASWQALWDNTIIPFANSLNLQSDASIVGSASDTVHQKFLILALVGWIENTASYHNTLLSAAKYLANTESAWGSFTNRRYQLLAQAYAYDFLRTGLITFPDADRKTIGDSILAKATYVGSINEYLDGHSAGNLMSQFLAALAIAGESGSGFNFTTAAAAILNAALDFWMGATAGGPARIEADRYFSGDGGSGKGFHYETIAQWHTLFILHGIHSGFVRNVDTPNSLLLNGETYAPWGDAGVSEVREEWVEKIPEWWLNGHDRGDGDYLRLGDTGRVTSPWFHHNERLIFGTLITRGGAWRKRIRWFYDRLHKIMTDPQPAGKGESVSTTARAYDLIYWDPGDAANASESPKAAGTPKARLFSPWGDYFHRNTFDYDQGCVAHLTGHELLYEGHEHLNVGALQIWLKGDGVLVHAGKYGEVDSAQGDSADLGGLHNKNYYQQSISHSGVLQIDDGTALPHKSVNSAGSRVSFPSGLGGQYWKQFDRDGNGSISGTSEHDPRNINELRFDGGGLAWRRTGKDALGTDRLRVVEKVDGQYSFLHADIHRAYLLRHDWYDLANSGSTVRDRLKTEPGTGRTGCEFKWLFIDDVWQWPVILIIARMRARDPNFVKRQVWHTHGTPNFIDLPNPSTRRYFAAGSKNVAKIYIDQYRGPLDFVSSVVGGGSTDSNGWQANQYAYVQGGTNYKPSSGARVREVPDLGRHRIDFRPASQREEDVFATALFPMEVGQDAPTYTWIDEANWLGLDFGSGKTYRVNKHTVQVSVSGDTTPPAPPTGLVAIPGPDGGQVTLSWNANLEPDIRRYQPQLRTA